jgi:hypothetical protein
MMKNSPSGYISSQDVNTFAKNLTKRELFAAIAMQGFNSNPEYSGYDMFEISRLSVKAANLLMEELNK